MATAYLLPNIGATGAIKLAAPFEAMCAPNVPYRVSGLRTFQDVVADGKDPYLVHYEPYGITDAKYIQDASDDVCIVSLTSPSGDTVTVPNSYLLSLPVSTGIPYATMMVGINLGALPMDLSLSYFMTTVKQLAHDLLGINNADVKAIKGSSETYVSLADANSIEAARKVIMETVVTDAAKLRASEEARAALQAINSDLEAYILTRLPPP
jgi:hypothetical protein